ncbi:MAG: FG-GAP-like repeat-containing protein [Pseudomonadota bacterium]
MNHPYEAHTPVDSQHNCRSRALLCGLAVMLLSRGAAAQFPPEVDLGALLLERGGDGSEGFVAFSDRGSGESLSRVADLNGDGRPDLLIADVRSARVYGLYSPLEAFPAETNLESLFVENGGDGSEGFVIFGPDAGAELGFDIDGAGDVNGDGLDDFILGARFAQFEGATPGEAYLIFGQEGGFEPEFQLSELFASAGGDGQRGVVFRGAAAGDLAGRSVAGVGDVNGDGVDDVLIGAITAAPDGVVRKGEAYLIYGSNQPFPAEVDLASLRAANGGDGSIGTVFPGVDEGDQAGAAVGAAGDLNVDGIDDIIIGANTAGGRSGEAYVVYGRAGGFGASFLLGDLFPENGGDGGDGLVILGRPAMQRWGSAVGSAGDTNGDGFDDLFVGAQATTEAGDVAVILGRSEGFGPIFEIGALNPSNGGDGSEGLLIKGVSGDGAPTPDTVTSGDINGDRLDDLIIGVPAANNGRGYTFVIYGQRIYREGDLFLNSLFEGTGDGSLGFVLRPPQELSAVGGESVAAVDLNGDGIDDIATGLRSGGSIFALLYGQLRPAPSLNARVVGMDSRSVACRNVDTGQTVNGALPNVSLDESFDCGELGLDFALEQLVTLQADGVKFGNPGLSGEAGGLEEGSLVTCTNLTTTESATVRVLDGAWDCANAGFAMAPGDEGLVRIQGVVGGPIDGMPPPVPLIQLRLFVMDTRTAVCRNDTTGEVVALDLPDVGLSTQLDCIDLGLQANVGDQVSIQGNGRNFGSQLVARFKGFTSNIGGRCENRTTGQIVNVSLDDGVEEFDCRQLGLRFGDSDDVSITVRGNVR